MLASKETVMLYVIATQMGPNSPLLPALPALDYTLGAGLAWGD